MQSNTKERTVRDNKLSLELAVNHIEKKYRRYLGADKPADAVDVLEVLREHWPQEDMAIINIACEIAAIGPWVPKNSCSEWIAAHGAY